MNNLIALVLTVQRTLHGEAFIRLKVNFRKKQVTTTTAQQNSTLTSHSLLQDPTGTVGGTLAKGVLEAEPDIHRGSVLLLRKVLRARHAIKASREGSQAFLPGAVQVAVLKTPPPCSMHHLCIQLDNITQVIPEDSSSQPLHPNQAGHRPVEGAPVCNPAAPWAERLMIGNENQAQQRAARGQTLQPGHQQSSMPRHLAGIMQTRPSVAASLPAAKIQLGAPAQLLADNQPESWSQDVDMLQRIERNQLGAGGYVQGDHEMATKPHCVSSPCDGIDALFAGLEEDDAHDDWFLN